MGSGSVALGCVSSDGSLFSMKRQFAVILISVDRDGLTGVFPCVAGGLPRLPQRLSPSSLPPQLVTSRPNARVGVVAIATAPRLTAQPR